jgi:formiminotetrahydrofolate cyclodeaminase
MTEHFSLEWTLDEFLTRAASAAPTPGGGSVAAYTAALGFAMLSMVANLTVGREKYRAVEEEARRVLGEAAAGLAQARAGVSEDIHVFEGYMQAYKMPRDTPEAATRRLEALRAATQAAAQTPLVLARVCAAGLRLAVALAPVGNKGALSDVGVAACLLESALESALLSVDINLGQIAEPEYTEPIRRERENLRRAGAALRARALEIVQAGIA